MAEEYIQLNPKFIAAGMGVGLIAASWSIVPFFMPGVGNLLYVTVILATALLGFVTMLKKDKLIQTGITAIITFLAVSYLAVPTVTALVTNDDFDATDAENEYLEKLELTVPDMFCEGCAYSVGAALKGIPGVVSAKADLDTKSAEVYFDPSQVSADTIVSNDVVAAYGGSVK